MTRLPLFLAALVACGTPASEAPAPVVDPLAARELAPAHPPAPPAGEAPPADPHAPTAAPTQQAAGYSGVAGEVLEGGGYTYVRIDSGGTQTWVAGPSANVQPGEAVTAGAGSEMRNFESKTLQRTFASVQFVPWIRGPGAAPATQPTPAAAPTVEPVEPLPGGQTVAQIFAEKAALANKPVAVRGRVTKVTPGVMGTTFVHLQDGTGSAADRTHDLTVTTNDSVEEGQTVVVRGTLITDKDFGAGYRYDVLVEDANISK